MRPAPVGIRRVELVPEPVVAAEEVVADQDHVVERVGKREEQDDREEHTDDELGWSSIVRPTACTGRVIAVMTDPPGVGASPLVQIVVRGWWDAQRLMA
jgi:hypothetical protein